METFLKKFEESNPEKRDRIVKKISENVDNTATFLCLNLAICSYTTLLPILQKWPEEFRGMIERALVDQDMRTDLEDGKLINWCRTAQILYPLNTTKDGNCLLHSISLYIWGVEDHSMLLRRLLFCTLQTNEHHVFKQRYFHFMANRNDEVYGNLLHFDSTDQEHEWRSIVDVVEPKHIPSFALPLSYLEPIHIYVMANILKRPIIVMADPRIRTFEAVSIQDNDIVGIYLPLDVQPGHCYKYPVVLGFNFNHFTPLVTTKADPHSPRKLSIPLQKHDLSMLPVRFLYAVEERQIGNLMASYLHLIDLVHSEPISGAKLGDNTLPEDLNLTQEYFQDCEKKYRRFLDAENPQGVFGNPRPSQSVGQQEHKHQQGRNVSPPTMSQFQTVRCITQGCNMYGSASTGNMCSECLKKYTMEHAGPPLSLFLNEVDPTAPPPTRPLNSMSNITSMVEQKCQTPGCTFMCSLKTYPLCHECKEKTRTPTEKLTVNVHRQASNQTEELTNLSARLNTNVQTGINFTPQTQSTTKQAASINSQLSESELFGAGNGCLGEVEVPSGSDLNSQTHLVSNLRKEAEVIPSDNFPRRASPHFGSPKKAKSAKSSCSNSGCPGTSLTGNSLCSLCYMKTGIPGSLQRSNQNSPTHQLTNQKIPFQRSNDRNSPVLQRTNQHQAVGSNRQVTTSDTTGISKSSTVSSQKHLCSTAGSGGIRQENKFGMCVTCFEGVPREKVKQTIELVPGLTGMKELDMNRQGSIEDNLEVSETPTNAMIEPTQVSCMEDDSVKCASPLCDTLVYPPNKLCQICLDVLRQHQLPSPNRQPNQAKIQTCKKSGCEFHGAKGFDGFCSGCYNKSLAGNLHIVTNNNSAPISRQNKFPVETPQPRSNSAPITKKGAKCKVEGCSYFGDPKFSNMCTNCYHIFKPKSADTIGHERYPVQEASLFEGASNLVSNSFDRSAQILEQSRKEQSLCKRYGCKNHGNSNCEGFCNDCFRKYYQPTFQKNYH